MWNAPTTQGPQLGYNHSAKHLAAGARPGDLERASDTERGVALCADCVENAQEIEKRETPDNYVVVVCARSVEDRGWLQFN